MIGNDGETIKIEVKSNVDYTMTLPDVDWINKEESRGISAYTHYLAIAPNETYDHRNAVVYFQSVTENLKDSISITQLQKDAIIVAKNEYTIAADGGSLLIEVNSNVQFEVTTSVDWIIHNAGSRGLESKHLNFIVNKNEGQEKRSGIIKLQYKELSETITVTQNYFNIEGNIEGMPILPLE